MKLRYLFASLAAIITLFTSCDDKYEATTLSEIKVSSSIVAIPLGGGSTSIELTTADSYEVTDMPDWLTVTPASGSAGSTKLTFSAESAIDGRSAESVKITSGGKTQLINVIQGLATVSTATCAEVLAGVDNKTYRVTGTCTSIASTSYGNFYMNDGTGELYIYGTVDNAGAYNWAKFGIEVGDEVTVEGPKTTYNGVVELKDATFISVSKSLIKVDSIAPENGHLTSDGGDVEVFLVNKGNDLRVSVPEDAQDWMSIKSVQGSKVTFHISANTGAGRSTTVEFQTESNDKLYTAQTTIMQDGLSGTIAVPFSVTEAIAYCKNLSGPTPNDFAVKGKVSKVLYDFSERYGTATFWISEDGTSSVAENGKSTSDQDHDFECYSVYYFGFLPWQEGNAPISVGDEVVVYGQLTNYNGTAETNSGKAYVYSINGVTSDTHGVGSLNAPFTTDGATQAVRNGYTGNAYVTGIISNVVYSFSAKYGTATFWISDDGNYIKDELLHNFEAYSIYYLGNQPWVEGNTQIAVGDKVTLYGTLTSYNGVAETSSKKAYIYSLNGKTE